MCASGNIQSHPAQNVHLFWADKAFFTVSVFETLTWASTQMFSFNSWLYIQIDSLERGNESQISVKNMREFLFIQETVTMQSWLQYEVKHELSLPEIQNSFSCFCHSLLSVTLNHSGGGEVNFSNNSHPLDPRFQRFRGYFPPTHQFLLL